MILTEIAMKVGTFVNRVAWSGNGPLFSATVQWRSRRRSNHVFIVVPPSLSVRSPRDPCVKNVPCYLSS